MKLARSIMLAAAMAATATAYPCRGDDTLVAEAAFAEARAFMAKGLYAQACPKFEASYALDPALGTLMNLAECLRLTGRTASAWLRFRTAAAEALRLGQPERESLARERAAMLEPKLCRVHRRGVGPSAAREHEPRRRIVRAPRHRRGRAGGYWTA